VVKVSASNLEALVSNAREDYLLPPTTATPDEEADNTP
jgi:hypothetical protein